MEKIQKTSQSVILRLDAGEELRATIEEFCAKENIHAAWVEAIGSTEELELAYFDTHAKEYKTKRFEDFLEIVQASGNIALKDGKPFAHLHGTFSRESMETLGGHIQKCVISATAEVYLRPLEGHMERQYDDETGLFLLNPQT